MQFCYCKNTICSYDDVDLPETRSLTNRCANEGSEEPVKMKSP